MKKIYSRPLLAVHGGATELTRGRLFGQGRDFTGFRSPIIEY
ncbi:MAG TPA: hypothetical protein VEW03_03740 [Longimicrobiaceae bacterium]|nr:hypothetical protein [Longimicrobiaceae bacterium]